MSTIHSHSSHNSGCNGPNCRTKIKNNESQQDFTNALIGIGIGLGVLNGGLGTLGRLTSVWNAREKSTDNSTFNVTVSVAGNKRSSEDIQAEIDSIYTNQGVADDAALATKVEEAKDAKEKAEGRITGEGLPAGEKGLESQIKSTKDEIKGLKDTISTTKDNLREAENNLKTAQNALKSASPDDANYIDLVTAESQALATRDLFKKEKADAEKKLKEKEDALNKLDGAKKQAEAEFKTANEKYDALVQAQDKVKELKNDLEKAKAREAREKKEAEEAEAKRKREEEIDHLSNGDTANISRILRQIKNSETWGLDGRVVNLREKLDGALEQYYKNHKVGDNKAVDDLPEAKAYQTAV